jgi:RNA polymerase sigma factor (sigma-70 family)
MSVEQYIKEISSHPILNAEQEKELGERAKQNPYAKNEFIQANLRLVVNIAKRYNRNGDLLDLIQEGNIGLMHAVDRYNPSLGYRFSTYGNWYIKQSILRYLQQSKIDSLPYELQTVEKRLYQTIDEYFQKNGHEPDYEYLSNISEQSLGKKYSLEEITNLQKLFYDFKVVSIDKPIKHDSDTKFIDLIGDNYEGEILDKLSHRTLAEVVEQHIIDLKVDDIDKNVIRNRLFDDKDYNHIAEDLGITRERVKQKYLKGIKMLKSSFINSPIYKELELG